MATWRLFLLDFYSFYDTIYIVSNFTRGTHMTLEQFGWAVAIAVTLALAWRYRRSIKAKLASAGAAIATATGVPAAAQATAQQAQAGAQQATQAAPATPAAPAASAPARKAPWKAVGYLGLALGLAVAAILILDYFQKRSIESWSKDIEKRESRSETRLVATQRGTRYQLRDSTHCVSWEPDTAGLKLASIPSFVVRYRLVNASTVDSMVYVSGTKVHMLTPDKVAWLEFITHKESKLPFSASSGAS